MSGTVTLRRAGPEDLDEIVAVQHAAYAPNRVLLGVEPLPLQADYAAILAEDEVWLATLDGRPAGVLILTPREADLLIWSVATHPEAQGHGIGRRLLAFAEDRAAAHGRDVLRLYTGQKLAHNVDWYARHGYEVERHEDIGDRTLVHMVKIRERDEERT